MNLVLLEDADFRGGSKVHIEGSRAGHILNVLEGRRGDRVRVGRLGGRVGTGVIEKTNDGVVELSVTLDADPPPKLPLTLCIALPRPKALVRVLASATAIGARRIVLMGSWKVKKSYWSSPVLHPARIAAALARGLEQAGDTIAPEVGSARLFKPFVEDELPGIADGTAAFVAHPRATSPCPRSVAGRVTLAIGPDGGWTDYEVEKLEAVGFKAISLGPRVLRTGDAFAALAGRLF